MLLARWHLAEMRRDSAERHLPLPYEEMARDRCLRPGIDTPDLVTVKVFLRFYIATSRPQFANVPTTESINTVSEWFFAGFTRVTGTDTNEEERSEVYDVRPALWVPRHGSLRLTPSVGAQGPHPGRPGGEQTTSRV